MSKKNHSQLYKVVNFERVPAGFSKQYQMTEKLSYKPQQSCFWRTLKNGSTKFHDVIEICDLLGLELVIRNPKTNQEHKFNFEEDEKERID